MQRLLRSRVISTAAIGGSVLLLAGSILIFPPRPVEAKTSVLTFEKVVILGGGGIEEAVEITDPRDLAGSALDSIRPATPAMEDLGTAYELVLYAAGSAVTFDVAYFASRRGDRGFIYQPELVLIGGGQISPGWSQPSQPLEDTLRNYGAVMLAMPDLGGGSGPDERSRYAWLLWAGAALAAGLGTAGFAFSRMR